MGATLLTLRFFTDFLRSAFRLLLNGFLMEISLKCNATKVVAAARGKDLAEGGAATGNSSGPESYHAQI